MSDVTARQSLKKPIPERIREAREARGFQLEAFAEMLNVTKQAVAQFESGLASPSGETMRQIISATNQPPSFFVMRRERSSGALSPFWRGLKRMELHHRKRISRRLEWARDIVGYVEQFIEVPSISLPKINFDALSGTAAQIEKIADTLRDHWGLGRGPVRDLSALLEVNGFVLVHESVSCPDMDAVSCWQAGRPYILFSAEVTSGPRNLWNLAHELAHVLLHSSVEVTSENLTAIENQANRFAGAFLLPQDSFSREVLGTSLNHFLFLKEKWGVAIAAMAYRCKDLGIVNTNQHSYVMRQLNFKKIRKREPLDDRFKIREPSILGESIKMLLENGVQTRSQIEETLALNLSDVKSLCGLPKDYLGSRIIPFRPRLHNNRE